MTKIILLTLIFSPLISWSGDLVFTNITQTEMENIVSDFSGNFAPSTVSSAASLGKLFGIELGLLAGATKTPNIEAYAERSSGQDASNSLPHGGIFAAVSVPFGITLAAGGIPKLKGDGGEFNYAFMSAKWTFWDTLVDAAVKLDVAKMGFTFSQTQGGVNGTVEFTDTIKTLVLMASKNFIFIEPYIGLGIIRTDGKLKVTGTGTVFDTSYTTAQEASQDPGGGYSVLGINLNLFILKFGAEVYKTLNTQGATAKLSFYF